MRWFKRSTSGSTVPPNVLPPSIALDTIPRRNVGPGGGKWWGGGPRWWVGSRGPDPARTEVGRPGDMPTGGDVWGPSDDDMGFPTSTRWPGYPSDWVPPYYDTGTGFTGGAGYPGAGEFMGGSMLAGRVSTVFMCTDLVSRLLATIGLKVMRMGQPIEAPPWIDNPEPEIYTSIVEAMQAIVNSMLHRGEALIAPTARYADGTVARWVVLNPDMVDIEAGTGGVPIYSIGGITIPRTEILHMRYQTWPGCVRGIGPLEACSRNIISADALQSWGTQLATTNGIPMAVLQSEVKLTKEQARAIKTSWAEASMSRGVIPAVLTGGLTYTPLNLKPADVGLLDLRYFDERRIASCIGVPLWLVGLPMSDGMTYTTVEDTFDYFWRATLRPLAYNIGCGLSGWALPRGVYLRFPAEQLTEPGIVQRAQVYSTLIPAGVITVDEARQAEHLPPLAPVAEEQDVLGAFRNQGV